MIDKIGMGIPNLKQIQQPVPIVPAPQGTQPSEKGFSNFLGDAIHEVNNLHMDANKKIEGLVLGGEGVNTHDAILALEKADVAFQLMNKIRQKIVRAYEEVMRTQV